MLTTLCRTRYRGLHTTREIHRLQNHLKLEMASSLMPLLFLSHGGGPCFFMDGDQNPMFKEADHKSDAAMFLKSLQNHVGVHPRAILVISAHWEENDFTVGYQQNGTSLIYDYYGFPAETYAPHLLYSCPTDLSLADKVVSLIQAAGISCSRMDRGFDHGVFIPLKLAYPEGNIPIVQLSLRADLNPAKHIALGESITSLRSEGVLIIGSGQMTHNLPQIMSSRPGGTPPSKTTSFLDWIHQLLIGVIPGDDTSISSARESLVNMMTVGPHISFSHPRTEHLIPLHVIFGAAFPSNGGVTPNNTTVKRIFQKLMLGSMSLDSYLFS